MLGPDVPGTLTVISIQRAETDPARSVVATVDAGCQPVRVITSADGRVVWVTARASDALLGFSAARLRGDPAHALIARVRVGEAPVGLALVDHGGRIVVADSDRFQAPGATSSLAVVNVGAALAGKPALAGLLPAGRFPREMAPEPGGRTLLVTNFASGQVELVNVAGLP
jgi:DNA-binding beta-propeller fold protein YncE